MNDLNTNNMNLEELKEIKRKLNMSKNISEKDENFVKLGDIVVYESNIGTVMRIMSAYDEEYGMMGIKKDTELGKQLYSARPGKVFNPYSGYSSKNSVATLDNILTVDDIIDIMMIPDETKNNNKVEERDIVLVKTKDGLKLYRVSGSVISHIVGVILNGIDFRGARIGSTISSNQEQIKILGSVTEKVLSKRITSK